MWGGGGLRTRWPERIGNDQMAGEESSHLHVLYAHPTITHTAITLSDEETTKKQREPWKLTCW